MMQDATCMQEKEILNNMKTRKYIEMSEKDFRESLFDSRELISGIEQNIIDKYFAGDKENYIKSQAFSSMVFPLSQILYFSGDIKGKRILDIGCGGKGQYTSQTSFRSRMYEPWLCRALLELDAEPIGIDARDNSEEEFENYQRDLFEKDSLSDIPESSVDIAHAKGLFNDPSVYMSPTNLEDVLIPQLERTVKPNGYFIYEE